MTTRDATEIEAQEWEARDTRIAKTIAHAIQNLKEEAYRLAVETQDLRRRATLIEKYTTAKMWPQLADVLDTEDIESLCNVSPSDMMERVDAEIFD